MNLKNFVKDDMGIRVRFREDSMMELNLKDTCIGLGFTQIKNNNLYFRYERINKYLKDIRFDVSPSLGKEDELDSTWILEPYFYKLSMKADKGLAIKFQDWIAFELLPSIRKNNFYIDEESITDAQAEKAMEILQKKLENYEASTLNNGRLKRKLEDFLNYTFKGKIDNPYEQFVIWMQKSGTLDLNGYATEKFKELNREKKLFIWTLDVCQEEISSIKLTNLGIVHLTNMLTAKDGVLVINS